ncbi:MAG: hypothetical protein PSY14_04255 [bacterium]|nr:hypothetical protein [bacterium]
MKNKFLAAALLVNALALPLSDAAAQDSAGEPKQGDVTAVISGLSHHFGQRSYWDENGQNRKWNETNYGAGLEYQLSKHFYVAAGGYKNSIHRASFYGGVGAETNGGKPLGLGIEAGLITGYEIPVVPSVIPYVRIGSRNAPVNLKINVIPPIKGLTPAVVAVQARFKIG